MAMIAGRLKARAEKWRHARDHAQVLGRPFDPAAPHRLLIVSLPERIPQSQIFPFRYYRKVLRDRHGIDVSEIHLEAFLEGDPMATGATAVAFQTGYDVDEGFRDILDARIEDVAPGARRIYLDWFAPTDLRPAALFDPVIDAYVKKNLLADRGLYGTETFGDTNLMEYYGKRFGLAHETVSFAIPDGFMDKLSHGPSFATADFILPKLASARLPEGPRPIDLHARIAVGGTPWYEEMRREALQAAEGVTGIRTVTGTGIRHDLFLRELRQSKLCFSPFGYGEVCWRDFEAVMTGAVLVKQEMSELESWPNIFQPMETYVPVARALSDFEGKVRALLADPSERSRIASNALGVLREFGRSEAFVDWAASLVTGERAA